MTADETSYMKQVDKFKVTPLLTGRTDIETITKGRNVLTVPSFAMTTSNPDIDDVAFGEDGTGSILISGGTLTVICPIFLPDAATITEVAMYGNAGAASEAWTLIRNPVAALTQETLASANVNSADSSIAFATVDNAAFSYHIFVNGMVTNDRIYSAQIKYKFE